MFSSFLALRALLRDYHALFAQFNECSASLEKISKEKSKYQGLSEKIQSWLLLAESCMLKDTLRYLKQLSLCLQSKDDNVMNAMNHIDDMRYKL